MIEIDYICPLPKDWHRICESLCRACAKDRNIDMTGTGIYEKTGVPIPLILNGWVFTSNIEKKFRWLETIKWAEENGYWNIIASEDFEKYYG